MCRSCAPAILLPGVLSVHVAVLAVQLIQVGVLVKDEPVSENEGSRRRDRDWLASRICDILGAPGASQYPQARVAGIGRVDQDREIGHCAAKRAGEIHPFAGCDRCVLWGDWSVAVGHLEVCRQHDTCGEAAVSLQIGRASDAKTFFKCEEFYVEIDQAGIV